MGRFYIYSAKINNSKFNKLTIIFNPNKECDYNRLKEELSFFYKNSNQTDGIVFIHGKDKKLFQQEIEEHKELLFKSIPKVEESYLSNNLFYIEYDRLKFKGDNKINNNVNEIIKQGLINIFVSNGGLVESNGISHHFEFPSGKHSSNFLRTANILVKKSQIDFIALNSLHYFKNDEFDTIYCDTLSINVVGYSIISILKRFNNSTEINVESFKSYDGLYNKNTIFNKNSIFLISASTSGGIIEYIKKNHGEVNSSSVCVLFYLPLDKKSEVINERVLCDLSFNKDFGYGIEEYKIYNKNKESCDFCNNHSTPIKIVGDSFSIDEPIINTKQITIDYIPKSLKDFVEIFKKNKDVNTSLKVSYSEKVTDSKKHNVYIDYENIILNINHYTKHKKKLDAYIQQFIPSSLKHIIYLNDKGSEELAKYIANSIQSNLNSSALSLINQSNLSLEGNHIEENLVGSILIVGSCINNGKNLLYLSRFFRNHENLRLVYFIGINRINNISSYRELKSNLKYGLYGSENSSFIEIEKIQCDNSNIDTPWITELNCLKKISEESDVPSKIIMDRINQIEQFSSKLLKGGSDNIFYSNVSGETLEIRKNSAFFNDNNYYNNISQSDIYFTISCVLNNMRNDRKNGLYQTSFVRNLLNPLVFNRFNDGVIQASILRAAKNEELNFSICENSSKDMLTLLITFLKYKNEYQGEALIEFLYAICISKLKLYKTHYAILIEEMDKQICSKTAIFRDTIKNLT